MDPGTGKVLFQSKGGELNVEFTPEEIEKLRSVKGGAVVSHNHPPGAKAGFALGDVSFAEHVNLKEIRVVGENYESSLSRDGDAWPKLDVVKAAYNEARDKHLDAFLDNLESGKKSKEEYNFELMSSIWSDVSDKLGMKFSSTWDAKLDKRENSIDLPSLKEPTEVQSLAGNYPKHHVRIHGLDVSVENPKGSVRKGIGADGEPWESILPAHYGYVRRTTGADGDHVDAFIGPNEESDLVFVIDQVDPVTGKFDEHKCLMGFDGKVQAEQTYVKAYSDGIGPERIGAITTIPISEFKKWLRHGDTTKPYGMFQNARWDESKHPRADDGKFGSGSGTSNSELPDHIQKLKIPPAWTNVTYSSDPNADLLVKGFDEKGREQRIYSDAFIEKQQNEKFKRVKELRKQFKAIDQQNNAKSEENKEDSDCLKLIMRMGIRPGSDKDTKAKVRAYGATTLEGKHVSISEDGSVILQFVGKKGVNLSIPVTDIDIQTMLKERKAKVGDDGRLFQTNASRLRDYSHQLDDGKFKPKDFRTRLASDIAENTVKSLQKPANEKEYKKQVFNVAKIVSEKLGNTPTVALQSYIDPEIFERWRQ